MFIGLDSWLPKTGKWQNHPSTGKWVNKLCYMHTYNGIFLGNKQEQVTDTWISMNKFEMNYGEWKMLDSKCDSLEKAKRQRHKTDQQLPGVSSGCRDQL